MRNQLTNMGSNASVQEKMDVSNQLSGTLKTIFALSESYPDLKANTNFIKLQEELTNTENKIAYSRQLYNSSVAQYNIKIQMIPNNIIANIGGFTKEAMLEIPTEAREVPKVQF
jgi:lemA protein